MKKLKFILLSTLGAATLSLALPTSALAATETSADSTDGPIVTTTGDIQIVASGESEDGGWVAFDGIGTVTIDDSAGTSSSSGSISTQALTSVSAGGGTWIYGTTLDSSLAKHCISEYTHPSKRHGSTAIMNGLEAKDEVAKGVWSYANVGSHTTATCYAYYHTVS